ncbi:MAG: hypothetical protein R2877_07135 [Bdellovibrionota bacterium]
MFILPPEASRGFEWRWHLHLFADDFATSSLDAEFEYTSVVSGDFLYMHLFGFVHSDFAISSTVVSSTPPQNIPEIAL